MKDLCSALVAVFVQRNLRRRNVGAALVLKWAHSAIASTDRRATGSTRSVAVGDITVAEHPVRWLSWLWEYRLKPSRPPHRVSDY